MILILTTHFIDFCTFLGFIAITIYRFTAIQNSLMQGWNFKWLGNVQIIDIVSYSGVFLSRQCLDQMKFIRLTRKKALSKTRHLNP